MEKYAKFADNDRKNTQDKFSYAMLARAILLSSGPKFYCFVNSFGFCHYICR